MQLAGPILLGTAIVLAIAQWYTETGVQLISSSKAKRTPFDKIIDVRSDLEWNAGHHPDAIHIPVSSLTPAVAKRHLGKKDSILVYCNTGQRARRAAEVLASYGYTNVSYIAGSYTELL